MSAEQFARQADKLFIISREIDAPRDLVWKSWTEAERPVFILSFSNPEGGMSRHPGHLQWPLQMLSTVTFQEANGGTTVTVQSEAFEATDLERKTFQDGMASMQQGWTGTFEQFDDYVAKSLKNGRP